MAADGSGRLRRGALGCVAGQPARWIAAVVATAVTMSLVTACTGGEGPDPTVPVTRSSSRTLPGAPAGIPPADLAAIRSAIDAINATAGGPVAAQRAELEKLAAPQQLARQRSCPVAQSTLAFQPAYRDLRTAGPDDTPASSSPSPALDGSSAEVSGRSTASVTDSADAPSGAGYLLPTFITIYTGNRITGTDLTTLRLWVIDGSARTGALCVS